MTTPDVQPTGRRNARMRQTVRDMLWSMAVVLALVAVIMVIAWRPNPDPVKVVETAPVVALASHQADFPLTAPTGLSTDWRATSARWEPTTQSAPAPVLHLGYVTPGGDYAQVSESTANSDRYLDEQTGDGTPSGEATVDGATWERRETDDRRSLVRTEGDVVTVVSGSASWEELDALAASLEPVTPSG